MASPIIKNIPELSDAQKDTFWGNIDIAGPDDCWPWKLCKIRGYGQLSLNGRVYLAHRVAFAISGGALKGLFACHRCDNPSCCNPSHIFPGTPRDNNADMVKKGRRHPLIVRGEASPNAKLTEMQVALIRTDCRASRAIAKDYGVSRDTIASVKSRRSWAHIA